MPLLRQSRSSQAFHCYREILRLDQQPAAELPIQHRPAHLVNAIAGSFRHQGRMNIVPEPFSENPPPTMSHLANEPPRDHAEAYFLACTGQIRSLSVVSAMDSA